MSGLLEVVGLVSGYGSGTVLSGVDLTVGPEEVVAVVGRNGAGKTTLLQTILGIVDGLRARAIADARWRVPAGELMRRAADAARAAGIPGRIEVRFVDPELRVANSGAPLDAALAQLPGTLQALHDGAPAIDAVIRRLAVFSSRLGTNAPRAIARALRATTPVLTKATPVLRDGTPVVRGARLIAKRLASAKSGLVTMFDVLAEPLKTFPTTLETLNSAS